MAKQIDPQLLEILKKYHPDPRSAVWNCHDTFLIKHRDIEIIAARAGVKIDPPIEVEINSEKKVAVVRITGHFGDRTEWSYGEASPHNNKNAYPISMAEKRGKDRVVLKLLGLHGFIYSNEEITEEELEKEASKKKYNQKETKPEPEQSSVEVTEKASKELSKEWFISKIDTFDDSELLYQWCAENAEQLAALSAQDLSDTRKHFTNRMEKLNKRAA
jgi:hypothetical protein